MNRYIKGTNTFWDGWSILQPLGMRKPVFGDGSWKLLSNWVAECPFSLLSFHTTSRSPFFPPPCFIFSFLFLQLLHQSTVKLGCWNSFCSSFFWTYWSVKQWWSGQNDCSWFLFERCLSSLLIDFGCCFFVPKRHSGCLSSFYPHPKVKTVSGKTVRQSERLSSFCLPVQ